MQNAPPAQLLALEDDQGSALAEYSIFPDEGLLCVRWHGHLTGAEIVKGVQQGSHWRDQFAYSLILNDKSDTSGDWSEALPWLQYEWLPLALEAGVKAMAYVFSPDRENRFASQTFVNALRPHMAIEVFEDLDLAMAWLRQQRCPENSRPAASFPEQ
ncbi:STAS/SEC14 domain-containing protein [Hymenobacter arizonensis]|uniref:SpoIIAA-like n=1 Tax=Hymenobacter arizonensis TaxID=1227077 RepID=A0A1I5Z1J2_HYMAR|nr:STAS/SEC14 domain-containing protein [Hymenobacter arizonensis]SFQ50353.1 hypothetical protein SAMN04515668_2613 [Hymenobacter arizonensis]